MLLMKLVGKVQRSKIPSNRVTKSPRNRHGYISANKRMRRSNQWEEDVLVQRKQLVTANVELVALLEGLGLDAFGRLNGKVDLCDGSKDLVDLSDGCLVLEVDGRIEIRDLLVCGCAHHLALDIVHELAHCCVVLANSLVRDLDTTYGTRYQEVRKTG